MRYTKYILSVLIVLLASMPIAGLRAADKPAETKDEQFNPKPMIMHHIADSHEFEVLQRFSIPLPCILYSSTNGLTTFLYHEGADVKGYKCEDGDIMRADGASFIDFSITKNVFTMLLAAVLLIFIFTSVAKAYETNRGKAPKGLQAVIEPLFVFVRDEIAKPAIGPKYGRYMPYILTIFFFILTLNILGMIPIFPGGANVTGNISFTFILALTAFLVINLSGTKNYWAHIFWMPGANVGIKLFMAPIEFVGIFSKPIALMIRLFANMMAGHIIVLSLISLIFVFGKVGASMIGAGTGALVAVPFTLFISCIEILVAFIQAFIFAMLTSVFIGMSLEDHGEGHHSES